MLVNKISVENLVGSPPHHHDFGGARPSFSNIYQRPSHLPSPFRVLMLGASGVGKTALTAQFMTSEYLNTYDASLGKFTLFLLHSGWQFIRTQMKVSLYRICYIYGIYLHIRYTVYVYILYVCCTEHEWEYRSVLERVYAASSVLDLAGLHRNGRNIAFGTVCKKTNAFI